MSVSLYECVCWEWWVSVCVCVLGVVCVCVSGISNFHPTVTITLFWTCVHLLYPKS